MAVSLVMVLFFVLLPITGSGSGNDVALAAATTAPSMRVDLQDVRWANYSDYLARTLSVSLLFQNVGNEDALNVTLSTLKADNRVRPLTSVPLNFGIVTTASAHNETVRFSVPDGVASFRARINLTYTDSRQTVYVYPDVPSGTQPPNDPPPANYINVKDFGAAGDGSADDTAEVQAAIDGAPTDSTVLFPAGTYKISAALTVSKPLHFLSTEGATIRQVSAASGIYATGAGPIEVRGLRFNGRQYAAREGWGKAAIAVDGASATSPFVGVTIEDCQFSTWGEDAIYAEFANNLSIRNNFIEKIYYAGMYMLSVDGGVISGNTVDTVIGTPNAYGIAVSRDGDHPQDPRSRNITIQGNTVRNVPNWEGIDTHAGENLVISGNTVESSRIGIAVGPSPGDYRPATANMAPLNVTVDNNLIDYTATNGAGLAAIRFTGAESSGGAGTFSELATGSVTNNSIKRHGNAVNSSEGAILAYDTQSLTVTGNVLLEPASTGIHFAHNNFNLYAANNTMTDVWSNSGTTIGIYAGSAGYNYGVIYRPALYRGSKVATYINNYTVGGQYDPDNQVVIY